jgi:HlyD family secretion protein
MKRLFLISSIALVALSGCNRNQMEHDASGTFETTDILVSAEVPGKIESLDITEGDQLKKGQYIGFIDTTQLFLKKLQLEATSRSVTVRKPNVSIQVAATKDQIAKANIEKARIQRLLRDGAATQKQLDDINSQLDVLKSSLSAQMNSLTTSVQGLDNESNVYQIQVAQIEDQLRRSRITSPMDGTVLAKYIEVGEITQTGKALFKIADTRHLFLKAYLVSDQLSEIKIGQKVTVFINGKDGGQKSYAGEISWIADEAEFTPKTIQTKDERQNLVYAVKIAVDNKDGAIKIGMYGDVDFSNKSN